MSKINSKHKGKKGELEFAKWLKERGIFARRTKQYCGTEGDADLVSELDHLHLEIKRVERININSVYEKAEKESKDKIPVVVHRSNRKPWLVTLKAEDYFKGYFKEVNHDNKTKTARKPKSKRTAKKT